VDRALVSAKPCVDQQTKLSIHYRYASSHEPFSGTCKRIIFIVCTRRGTDVLPRHVPIKTRIDLTCSAPQSAFALAVAPPPGPPSSSIILFTSFQTHISQHVPFTLSLFLFLAPLSSSLPPAPHDPSTSSAPRLPILPLILASTAAPGIPASLPCPLLAPQDRPDKHVSLF
jgi:hypothetical protein